MNLRYFGGHILNFKCGAAFILLVLLASVSTSRSKPLDRLGDDGEYDISWEGTFDSIWNKTKFWISDSGTPTEYFPEDEGFIRVYSGGSGKPPPPPPPKKQIPNTKRANAGKGHQNLKPTIASRAKREVHQGRTSKDGDEKDYHPLKSNRRSLLQTDGDFQTDQNGEHQDDSQEEWLDWLERDGKALKFYEGEGSGEGSGEGGFDIWPPPTSATGLPLVVPMTPYPEELF